MSRTSIETRPWDAAQFLKSEKDMAAYLEAALEEGDASFVAVALGDIARAKGMRGETPGSALRAPEGN